MSECTLSSQTDAAFQIRYDVNTESRTFSIRSRPALSSRELISRSSTHGEQGRCRIDVIYTVKGPSRTLLVELIRDLEFRLKAGEA